MRVPGVELILQCSAHSGLRPHLQILSTYAYACGKCQHVHK